ncbi:MAG TPA: SPW repeat protein [Planctomycetaceae bacterium]
MWPRTAEVMLACWLAVSPFVFRYSGDRPLMWWHDYVVATLLAGLALVSFVQQTRRAHLFELLIAAWLIGYGWATTDGIHDAPRQNWVCVGLLLLMLAIIPSDCVKPPLAWQEWNKRHGIGGDRPEDPYGRRGIG